MPRIGLSAAMLAAALASGAVAAQDPAQQTPPAQQTEDAEAPQDTEEDRTPPRDADDGAADDVFIPTEEIGADEEVTFPVDI